MVKDDYLYACLENSEIEKNPFIKKEPDFSKTPTYCDIKDKLPKPIWKGHKTEIEAYYKAWKTAFKNVMKPTKKNGFVSPYIDTAFNGDLFMWDSCFIMMFTRYANHLFNFQGTLDNFYSKQHPDGFICRQIHEQNGKDVFYRYDPVSTGPNVLAWTEWLYYKNFGDKKRLKDIFFPLLSYHKWNRLFRTWRDGSYWSSGWGCGMDNLPRVEFRDYPEYSDWTITSFYHGNLVWVDATLQAALSCKVLIDMADELKFDYGVKELKEEYESLVKIINEKLWDEKTNFYYDLLPDSSRANVKTIAAYWALIAKVVPENKLEKFVAHLENEKEFKTDHRVPALSRDNEFFNEKGGYWRGGVWPPTNYMLVKGLEENGYTSLAFEIAQNHYESMLEVYKNTGAFWENFAPIGANEGNPSRGDFVGWGGLPPIAVFIEYILGIQLKNDKKEIVWYVNQLEEHGIENLSLGGNDYITLICRERKSKDDKPEIEVKSTKKIKLRIVYAKGEFEIQ